MSRITSITIYWYDWSAHFIGDIDKQETSVYRRTRIVKHRMYNSQSNKPVCGLNYSIDKLQCEDFFIFLDDIVKIRDWKDDYSVPVCDGWAWKVAVRYSDKSQKLVKGTIKPPPFGKEIANYIKRIAMLDDKVRLFT